MDRKNPKLTSTPNKRQKFRRAVKHINVVSDARRWRGGMGPKRTGHTTQQQKNQGCGEQAKQLKTVPILRWRKQTKLNQQTNFTRRGKIA